MKGIMLAVKDVIQAISMAIKDSTFSCGTFYLFNTCP
jgi:hypothetical protein